VNTFNDYAGPVWDFFTGSKLVSLRAAINQANQEKSPEIIMLPAGNYPLSLGKVLEITSPAKVTIEAADPKSQPVIDALGKSGVFQVDKGSEVDFESLWIQGGKTPSGANPVTGGGIQNYGTVEINNSYLYENTSDLGGGLLNQGMATVTNTVFYGNYADHGGGGVYNTSVLSTTNCVFWNNKAGMIKDHGLGGGLENAGAQATLIGGAFLQNFAGAAGGGLYSDDMSTTIISNVNFLSNKADDDGGGVDNWGSMAILGGTFSTNSSGFDGGGAFNGGRMTVSGATFTGNTAADDGGGIRNNDNMFLNVVNCTFTNNSAGTSGSGSGGGIYSRGGLLMIDPQTKQNSSGNTPNNFDIS
jgi:predicted outer membrane repeat protein